MQGLFLRAPLPRICCRGWAEQQDSDNAACTQCASSGCPEQPKPLLEVSQCPSWTAAPQVGQIQLPPSLIPAHHTDAKPGLSFSPGESWVCSVGTEGGSARELCREMTAEPETGTCANPNPNPHPNPNPARRSQSIALEKTLSSFLFAYGGAPGWSVWSVWSIWSVPPGRGSAGARRCQQ